MMKIVDMAMIRAVARCPWPESSAGTRGESINVPADTFSRSLAPVRMASPWGQFQGTLFGPGVQPLECALATRSGLPVSSPRCSQPGSSTLV
jgi:hypothetical protein